MELETIIEKSNNTEEVLGFAGLVEDAISSLKYAGAILATIGAVYILYSK